MKLYINKQLNTFQFKQAVNNNTRNMLYYTHIAVFIVNNITLNNTQVMYCCDSPKYGYYPLLKLHLRVVGA